MILVSNLERLRDIIIYFISISLHLTISFNNNTLSIFWNTATKYLAL